MSKTDIEGFVELKPDMARKTTTYFRTYTVSADAADEFATNIRNELLDKFEYADIGDLYPVVFNGSLHYTFTIRAGYYE